MSRLVPLLQALLVLFAVFAGALGVEVLSGEESSPEPSGGVVVEEVVEGTTLAMAGLQPADVLYSWKRLPKPPHSPNQSEGSFESPFDWWEVAVEQGARGTVVLGVRRDGKPMEFVVQTGDLMVGIGPVLPYPLAQLYSRGRAHIASGNLEAAAQVWRDLEHRLGAAGQRDLQAWFRLRIGEVRREKGERDEAVEVIRSALEVANSSQAQIAAWETLGETYASDNQFDAAQGAYLSALKIRKQLNRESLAVAIGLNNLGSVAWARRELGHARKYMRQALEIQERLAPGSLAVAVSLNNLGILALQTGDLKQAHEYHLRALQIRKQLAPQSLDVANSLGNLGSVAWHQGDLPAMQKYMLEALQIQRDLAPESPEIIHGLVNMGVVSTARGELDRAYDRFRQALEIQGKLGAQDLALATVLNNLGFVLKIRGELDRAVEYYEQALRIKEQLAPGSLEVATSLSNIGTIERYRGALDRAWDYFQRALLIEERLAPRSPTVAITLNNLGSVAHARAELDHAFDYHLRALRLQEQFAPRGLDTATSLSNLGSVAWDRGDLKQAQSYFFQSLHIREQLAPGSFPVADTLSELGRLAGARGELNDAYGFFSQALEVLEQQFARLGGSYNVQAGSRLQHSASYHDAMDLLLSQGRTSEAFHVLERFRARTFLAMLAERDTVFTADIPENLDQERRRLAVRYDRTLKRLAGLNLEDHAQEVATTRRELEELHREAGDIEAEIRRASPRLAALQYPEPLNATQAQRILDPGTLLLSYSVGEEKTALFTLPHSGHLQVKILPLGEEDLRSRVTRFRTLIQEGLLGSPLGERRFQRFQDASRELYDALLDPVAERIAASERLLILPDGPLHALPFAALIRSDGQGYEARDGDTGQYLVEWRPLHVALSATVYAELKERRHTDREGGAPESALQLAAFGDPIYPESLSSTRAVSMAANSRPAATGPPGKESTTTLLADASVQALPDAIVRSVAERGVFDWQPLPNTRHEVEGIARLFPGGTVRTFLGREALEERVKSLQPSPRILHLAAHGHTDDHFPSSSFIALTIPEETLSGSPATNDEGLPHDNGLLQVWEILERVRLDADLVVLSACDSALGKEMGGEGLIGLTRAFQYAGARTVAATLWKVADKATADLMIRFYRYLREGLSKDEALRAAQVEFIRSPVETQGAYGSTLEIDTSSPYYWAGFQVYGDWE